MNWREDEMGGGGEEWTDLSMLSAEAGKAILEAREGIGSNTFIPLCRWRRVTVEIADDKPFNGK